MKKIAIAILMSVFIAAPAVAADSGVYIGVKAGSSKKSVSGASETSNALGVFGGYAFNPNFAVELGYTDLGSVASIIEFTTVDVGAVGSFPISDQFSLYGKLGIASTDEKALGLSGKRTAATFGLGGQFNVTRSAGLRLGYDRHSFGDGTIFTEGDSDMWSVAAVFSF